jgi:hypothetical protein
MLFFPAAMPDFDAKIPKNISIEAITAVGEALTVMQCASSFIIDEKTKSYDLSWRGDGLYFQNKFREIIQKSAAQGIAKAQILEAMWHICYGRDIDSP